MNRVQAGGFWLAVAALAAAPLSGAFADTTKASCQPSAMEVLHISDSLNTGKITFVNMPGMTLAFKQGGTDPSCVLVTFSTTAITSTNSIAYVQPLLDGNATGLPVSVPLIVDAANYEVRTATFLFTDVPPGKHTVKMQFEASFVGGTQVISLTNNNLIVQHAP